MKKDNFSESWSKFIMDSKTSLENEGIILGNLDTLKQRSINKIDMIKRRVRTHIRNSFLENFPDNSSVMKFLMMRTGEDYYEYYDYMEWMCTLIQRISLQESGYVAHECFLDHTYENELLLEEIKLPLGEFLKSRFGIEMHLSTDKMADCLVVVLNLIIPNEGIKVSLNPNPISDN